MAGERTGRKPDLNPAVQEFVCQAIRAGTPPETAAVYAGIHRATYYRWMQRGQDRPGAYRDFRDAVQKALADFEVRNVTIVQQAATKNWVAAMTLLERRFPERWGRRDRAPLTPEIEREAEAISRETGVAKETVVRDIRDYLKRSG